MLKFENVTKYYGDFLAVDNLNFTVDKGEIFGLLGVNGAGKTTTFRMLMGLLDATNGNITFNGKKIDYDITDDIGFLTEERSLLTKMTIEEQVIYFGVLKGMKEETIIKRLDELLIKFYKNDELFDLNKFKKKKIKELSKGNQQKIQFITSIINKPKLLILDEPFSGLDPFNIELFKNEIKDLSVTGSIIIFSSHRMEHVELFCKKLVVLTKGQVVLEGELKKIKEDFRKKNIFVQGDFDEEAVKKIDGVISITDSGLDKIIKIESSEINDKVFKIVSKGKNIIKYSLEEPSLEEIFVSTVGEAYEK